MNGRPTLRKVPKRKPTSAQKMYDKSMDELQESITRNVYVMFSSLALALNKIYGWNTVHIQRVLHICQEVWLECSNTQGLSMIQMCYDETGIAVTNDSEKDFEELAYLSEKYWQEAKKHNHFKTRDQELIYMSTVRRKQAQWMKSVVASSIFLSLYRREGFGVKRCQDVYEEIRNINLENNNDPYVLCELCRNLLHIDVNGFLSFDVKEYD